MNAKRNHDGCMTRPNHEPDRRTEMKLGLFLATAATVVLIMAGCKGSLNDHSDGISRLPRLAPAPTINIEGDIVTWNPIEGAAGYILLIDGNRRADIEAEWESFNLASLGFEEAGDYAITLVAQGFPGRTANSEPSNSVTYTVEKPRDGIPHLPAPKIDIAPGSSLLKWNPVSDAIGYILRVDGIERPDIEITADATELNLAHLDFVSGCIITLVAIGVDGVSLNSHPSNRVVYEIWPNGIEITQFIASMDRGTEHKFDATVSPDKAPQNGVKWSVAGDGAVTITQNGLLAIPAGVRIDTELTITAATTLPTGAKHVEDSVIVKVTGPEPTEFAISPTSAEMEQGESLQFTASLNGPPGFDDRVKWSVSPTNAGASITGNGFLTLADYASGTFTVTAESEGYPDRRGGASVTVIGSGALVIIPPNFPSPGDFDVIQTGHTISLAKDGIQARFTVADVDAEDTIKWFYNDMEIGIDAGSGDNTHVSGDYGQTLNLARRIHGNLLGTAPYPDFTEHSFTVEVVRKADGDERPRSLVIRFRVTL